MLQLLFVLYMSAGLCVFLTPSLDGARDTDENRATKMAKMKETVMAGWIDSILEHARSVLRDKGLNEIHLPPETAGFNRNVLGIKWHGEASILDGVLIGLETIYRSGPAHIATEPGTGDLVVATEVGADNPTVRARAIAKFMSLGPSTNITGSFDKVRVKTRIRISNNSSGFHINLDEFKITDLGKLSLKIKGLGSVLNYLGENIFEVLGNRLFKRQLQEFLQGTIKDLIIKELPSITKLFGL